MNAYLDLMFLNNLIINMVGFHLIKSLTLDHIKRRSIIIVSVLFSFENLLIFLNKFVILGIIICFETIIFFLFFKKKFVKYFIIHKSFVFFLSFFLSLLFDGVEFKKFMLVITSAKGEWSIILVPIIYFFINLACFIVDSLFHLRNFKVDAMLFIDGKKFVVNCYLDTGNTLKYGKTPVIFLTENIWPNWVEKKPFLIDGIDSKRIFGMKEATIQIGSKKESQFVYLATKENIKSYNGCSCLLNAYLC